MDNSTIIKNLKSETSKTMEITFNRIIELIKSCNSADLIERLATFHYATNRIDGENEMLSIAQHEFLCALALAYGNPEIENDLDFRVIDELIDLVDSYFVSWSFNNTSRKMDNIDDNDIYTKNKESLLSSLASYYAIVRGDAIFDQVIKEYNDLLRTVDDWLLKKLGFNCDDINEIVDSIQTKMDSRIKERNERLRLESKSLVEDQILLITDKSFKHNKETRKLLKMTKTKKGREEIERRAFLMLEDKSYKGLLRFKIIDLTANLDSIKAARYSAFLRFFSTQLIDNMGNKIRYPNDDNLFRDKPIVRTGDEEYIFPCLSSLVWAIRNELELELKKDLKAWDKYQKKKSLYVVTNVENSFKNILPKSEIHSSLFYYTKEDNQGRCELDTLVLFDNNVFIIESKSGAYQKPARRGAYGRLQDNIKTNIENAYQQAKRALDYIKENTVAKFYDEKDNLVIEFEVCKYQRFYLINATLDNFGQLATRIDKLADIGLYSYKEFPWSINIHDLSIIADFIEFPSQFIHYLDRRIKINRSSRKSAEIESTDELDYFGTYMEHGLYFDDEEEYDLIQIPNYAPYFNEYYMGKKYGHEVKKLTHPMEARFKEIINNFENQSVFGYTTVTVHFLNFSSQLRNDFIDFIDMTAQKARENKNGFSDVSFIIGKNPNINPNGLGVTIFSGYRKDSDLLKQKLEAFCKMKKYQQNAFEWIGILNFIDTNSVFDELLYIAYEKEYDDTLENAIKHLTKKPIQIREVGRNDPCPCGSGKKYKKCCGC